jgi:hypothetical protein
MQGAMQNLIRNDKPQNSFYTIAGTTYKLT